MATAHHRLRRLVRGKHSGARPPHWHDVLGMLHGVCRWRSPEEEVRALARAHLR